MNKGPKFFIFIISVICSLLFIGMAIPLVNGAIEPNKYYGIRIDRAFESDEMWYQINHYGGLALIVAGLFILAANIVLFLFRKKLNAGVYTGIFVAVLLMAVLIATSITVAYAQSL